MTVRNATPRMLRAPALGVWPMLLLALELVLALVLAPATSAQDLRPADEWLPELPAPVTDATETPPDLALPPVPAPPADDIDPALTLVVQRFDVVGSTVFGADALADALKPWLGRRIESEELLAARDAVTDLYRKAGYVTSGAVVPDQDVAGGVIVIAVVEGALADIDVRGNHRIRSRYLESRLRTAAKTPVDISRLERELRTLQRDPWIERVDARLEPTDRFGDSRLVVTVEEAHQWRVGLEVANDRSPAFGSTGIEADVALANLIGVGDVWAGRFNVSKGLRDYEARFSVPITPWDTRFAFRYRDTRTEVVEQPFAELDIDASSSTFAFSLEQPVYRGDENELWVELIAAYRQTQTTVFDIPFCFDAEGPDCDDPTASILRAAALFTRRTRSDVFAARTQVSFGIDVLGATPDVGSGPDGTFVSWLTQVQWAHVLPESWLGTQTLLRGDLQLANDPLLSIEQFAIGGLSTMRGYRQNWIVRDNGYILSGELRIPVWRDSLRRHVLEIVPFTDFGQAWNDPGRTIPGLTTEQGKRTQDLWSMGLGLRFMPRPGALAEFYWGGRLISQPNPHTVAQDYGIYFRIKLDAPAIF